MSSSPTIAISRRQFIAVSGAIGVSGAAVGRTESSESLQHDARATGVDYDRMSQLQGHEPIALAARKTALLIIDMQRYFVHPDYPFSQTWEKIDPGCSTQYFKRVKGVVIPNCQRLLARFRSAGATIIYTAFGSLREDGLDMPGWAREDNSLSRSVVGKPMYPHSRDPSWRIDDSLAPNSDELVVAKTTSGPLNSTKLDQMLHTLDIDTLVITGVVTDVCVTQAAREFADRDFKVVVVEDACAGFSEYRHHAALQTFAGVFGQVRSTKAVISLLSKWEEDVR